MQAHLSEVVEGEQVAFSDEVLHTLTDEARVRKVYKLPVVGGGKGKGKRAEDEEEGKRAEDKEEGDGQVDLEPQDDGRELEMLVLGCMALRGNVH